MPTPKEKREMRGKLNQAAELLLQLGVIRGRDGTEDDLSSLEGLSAEDLTALKELSGLTPEEVEALGESSDEGEGSVDGLKSALRKERLARKAADKELKALKAIAEKTKNDKKALDQSQQEEEQATTKKQADEAMSKSERLAARLVTNATDTTVIKVLQSNAKLKKAGIAFKDLDDALRLIDRDEIEVDQDDDDPSKVEIDEDSVVDALKALAKKKPHLLAKEEEGESSGGGNGNGTGTRRGGFSGTPRNNQQATRKAELVKKYPSLGR